MQQPVSRGPEAIDAKPEQPCHLDLHLWQPDEECAHERCDRPGSAQSWGNAATIGPAIELQGCGAGDQIERGVKPPAPEDFKNDPGEPQEPHVSDQVHDAAVQKVRGEITDGARMVRDEGIVLSNRGGPKLYQLLIERVRFVLKLRCVLHHLDARVIGINDVAIRILYVLPLRRMALLKAV